jgi:nucleoside-diphosphate-sugar epimerase
VKLRVGPSRSPPGTLCHVAPGPRNKLAALAESDSTRPRAAVTGGSGYLGGHVAASLLEQGWEVVSLSRRPAPTPGVRHAPFHLEAPVAAAELEGFDAVVHCAWDFGARSWEEIERVNVEGSRLLFEAAAAAGVERLVHVSTVSATGEPRSMYGRAKRRTEELAGETGGIVVRPGLLYGPGAGGMVGMLETLVGALPAVPVLVGEDRPLYLAHQDDAARLIGCAAAGLDGESGTPLTAAADDPHTLREVLGALAQAKQLRRVFFRVPWQALYAPLRLLELLRLPAPIRSDSALSIGTLDPDPFRCSAAPRAVQFRPFEPAGSGSAVAPGRP